MKEIITIILKEIILYLHLHLLSKFSQPTDRQSYLFYLNLVFVVLSLRCAGLFLLNLFKI